MKKTSVREFDSQTFLHRNKMNEETVNPSVIPNSKDPLKKKEFKKKGMKHRNSLSLSSSLSRVYCCQQKKQERNVRKGSEREWKKVHLKISNFNRSEPVFINFLRENALKAK